MGPFGYSGHPVKVAAERPMSGEFIPGKVGIDLEDCCALRAVIPIPANGPRFRSYHAFLLSELPPSEIIQCDLGSGDFLYAKCGGDKMLEDTKSHPAVGNLVQCCLNGLEVGPDSAFHFKVKDNRELAGEPTHGPGCVVRPDRILASMSFKIHQ